MKRTLGYFFGMFAAFLAFFCLIQKPLFILYNLGKVDTSPSFKDWWDIYYHGIFSDFATTSYLMVLPLLAILVGWMWKEFNPRPFLKWYGIVIAIIVALGVVTDTSMYEFWDFKLDRTVFFYINDPKNAAASVSVWYLIGRFFMWVILSVVLIFMLLWPLRIRIQEETAEKQDDVCRCESSRTFGTYLGRIGVFILLGGALFSMMRGWRIWPNTPGRAYYTSVTFYNHAAVNPIFNLFYSMTHNEIDAKQFHFYEDKELVDMMEGMFPTSADSTECLLNNQRPNILFVGLEGFGSFFIEGLGGIPDVGVNINRLLPECVCFSQCYGGSFRTDRGVVCMLSGYLGQPTTSIMRFSHKIRHLPGLAKTLHSNGYETQALYTGDITFFNMSEYLLQVGHETLISQDNFSEEERKITKWGVPDHIGFQWLYDYIVKKDSLQRSDAKERPWYTTYMTLSSHNPFDVPNYHRLEDKMYNAFAYTDSCFGDFIDRLKQTTAWENLLVVVVADHGFNWRDMAAPDFPFIPFLMMGGAIKEPRRIEKLVNQTDVAATILGQLGLPHDDFPFSRDVMGNTYVYPFCFNTYNNGFNFRDSTGCTVYDNDFKKAVSGEDARREAKGKAILQTLYEDIEKR